MIELKDTVKEGLVERFAEFRKMGIRTVMITGDNPRTAATIAKEAGVDDFIAQATPEAKIAFIREQQADGHLVAMTGDGTNDAPALAQSDVGLAMNSGTSAAKEAANMVDLDSDPTKLLEVIEIGKQLLITRGSITTFSIANDIAKYFAILPALFVAVYPELGGLNVMRLSTPRERDPVGGDLQRADHRRADPAGVARRCLPGGAGKPAAPAQPPHLRPRRHHRPVHRDQGDRCRGDRSPPRVGRLMTTFLRRVVWPAFALLVALTLITGVLYPAVVTAVAQLGFNHQANGSFIVAKDGRTIGSSLIGQAFSGDTYFWGRLSAAGATDANPLGYDASSSAGSNLGPTNPDLIDRINQSVADYQAANGNAPIPVDLITTSASGPRP